MNFQQLRTVREAIRRGFNLTEVARELHTSQPGVSRQIRELEEELGVDLFVRVGKRLIGLTEVGAVVAPMAEQVLNDADNMRRAGADYAQRSSGRLSIAATHSQARYVLPDAVRDSRTTVWTRFAPSVAAASSSSRWMSSSTGCTVRATNGGPMKVSATKTPSGVYETSIPSRASHCPIQPLPA